MKSKEEIQKKLREIFNFPKATEEEKKDWPYKSDLYVSYRFLKGKKLYFKEKYIGLIDDIYLRPRLDLRNDDLRLYIKSNGVEYSPTNCFIEYKNPYYNRIEKISLHPNRTGKKFWELGYLIDEKDYKSMYYTTKEYRKKFEKSLNEGLGTTGLTAPIQSKKIKNKISNTINERYGVNWFLERGCHYSSVTITMKTLYGIDNFFKDEKWQIDNAKKRNHHVYKGSSNLEKIIISEIEKIGFTNSYHVNSKFGQKVLIINKRKFYMLDFYNEQYNIVIEIMGDYWHCNPEIYNYDYYHQIRHQLASEVWKDDLKRKNEVINILNCMFFEIWETDWNSNKDNILMFLKNQIK